MEKKLNMKTLVILILLFVIVVMVDCNWQKTKELIEQQKKIDAIEIQVKSLWENVQQLQEEVFNVDKK